MISRSHAPSCIYECSPWTGAFCRQYTSKNAMCIAWNLLPTNTCATIELRAVHSATNWKLPWREMLQRACTLQRLCHHPAPPEIGAGLMAAKAAFSSCMHHLGYACTPDCNTDNCKNVGGARVIYHIHAGSKKEEDEYIAAYYSFRGWSFSLRMSKPRYGTRKVPLHFFPNGCDLQRSTLKQ